MSQVTVGKWGKNLAIRIPFKIAKAAGLSNRERVEIDTHDGNIVTHRPLSQAQERAQAAAEEIIAESEHYTLGNATLRERLRRLRIAIDAETDKHAWGQTRRLAHEQDLTLYDAAYLELAMRRDQPLASCDASLVNAAQAIGLEVLSA